MNIIQLLTLILLFTIWACSTKNSKQQGNQEKEIVESETETKTLSGSQFVTNAAIKQILSVTDTLFKGDTLKIKFKTPHFKDLAIVAPDDKFFFVVFYEFNDTIKTSLIDWNEFANLNYLEIITDKTKMNPWDSEIKENQLVFTKTGKYEIRLSENLETDDETTLVEVDSVYYIHKPRKK